MAPSVTLRRLNLRRFSETPCSAKVEWPEPPPKGNWLAAAECDTGFTAQVDVLLAKNDDTPVQLVKADLVNIGVHLDSIRTSEDGLGAMELMLAAQAGDEGRPLMLLVDTNMTDGPECARWAVSMARRGILARCPYVVGYSCCTFDIHESSGDSECGVAYMDYQDLDSGLLEENLGPEELRPESGQLLGCLSRFQNIWSMQREVPGECRRLCSLDGAEFIVADHWPICRLMLTMALEKLGVSPDGVHEAEGCEEAVECLQQVLERPSSNRPIVVFLGLQLPPSGGAQCAAQLQELLHRTGEGPAMRRHAFFVCVSASSTTCKISSSEQDAFNCFVSKASDASDISWVLQLCRLWWSERAALARPEASAPAQTATEGLASAMQHWRERRERRRKKTKEADGDGLTKVGSYGSQMRKCGHPVVQATHEIVAKALKAQWPGQCTCQAEPLLGSGSQADVYLGEWREPGRQAKPVAIKVFKMTPFTSTCFERELEIGRSMRHPNLVAMYGSVSHPVQLFVQEFCAGGSLNDILHRSSASTAVAGTERCILTQAQRLKIALDVARGMVALHGATPPVVHRDLKSANVLLTAPLGNSKTVPLAKVADFGLARPRSPGEGTGGTFMTRGIGSLRWMAPEVMASNDYGLPADVYSYGALLCELLSCSIPYGEDRSALPQPLETFVANGGRPDAAVLGRSVVAALSGFPAWLTELMRDAWKQEPAARPSFPEIVQVLMEHGSDPLVGVPGGPQKPCGGIIQLRRGPRGGWERVPG